ncbi:N-6 DNA methylase [Dolichospermum circinale]|uniref:N-6 DNA methylase n=1 Tax=Dolichospermum circinale TaxID=109265 RepID=UPI0003FAAC21|nr:N-6 DNA methylase [Dolichospermum circinale]MDB9475657.1 N-6 DNA methylase [Dolichospermum circinale CS-537/11]MDB9477069.1 N-6 DNA methylase [Dolichospermum circinale CS-537/03]MDB9481789.1 N-6 DNA methylase [Dolichospermum circinale CS-537/05]
MFYNTGIATCIWVLSNRKPEKRQGKVQLIDATEWYGKLRKNLGKKNCELTQTNIQKITETFLAFAETEESKIFDNADLGYHKITVDRLLRLKFQITIDYDKTVRGYEISFTKYFYKFKPLRSLEEIAADILALEGETEGVLRQIVSE